MKYTIVTAVNLNLELSVVIYLKELKVSSSSDISIVALYHQIFVLYSFSLNYNSRLEARGRRSFVSSDISIVALYYQIFVLYSVSLKYNSRLAARKG